MWVRNEMPQRGEHIEAGAVAWTPPFDVLNQRDTPLLAAVDPYGDTILNHIQLERQLPREVAYLRQVLHRSDQIAMLDELDRLAKLATSKVHRYLWFVGD